MNASASRIPAALWPAVSTLFDEALALPDERRPAWLQALDVTRPELAPYLRALLAAHETAHTLLPPDAGLLSAALAARASAWQAGQRIGIYRLLEPLGRGGMAAVWRAEQEEGVRRTVALKLPQPGLESPAAMARRFEQERDLLAALEHPHIARLYDAGISADGQPFLALELVQGQPIDRHAAALPLRQRLQLFLQVLDAVAFAHGRLVVHRDIKPANILVTPEGQARLLDFGIARLLGQADAVPAIGPGALPGRAFTPDCAAPEQLAGQVPGTAADVYSLGVVLYQLLCGQRPYTLDRHSALALAQQLAQRQVPPPSVAVPALERALAGDLDAIVMRALSFDPAERYATAEALAADIRSHLQGDAVQARGRSRRYLAGVFVRRHGVLLASAAAVMLALASGLTAALWQAGQAREQAGRALAVQRFMVDLFNASHPEYAQGRDIPARVLLDQGAQRLASQLQDQPAVRAELHREIGGIYVALGDNRAALAQVGQALALYAQLGQDDSDGALQARYLQFEALKEDQQNDAARQAAAQLQQQAERLHGPRHRWALALRENLAFMDSQQGDAAAAERQLLQALALAAPDEDPVRLIRARSTLGSVQLDLGRPAQARETFAAVLEAGRAQPGYEVTDELADRYNLARARFVLGEYAAVAEEMQDLVPALDRHVGARHDRTLKARGLWSQAEAELGQHTRALAIQRDNLAHAAARETADEEVLSFQRLVLAKLLKAAGRYAEGVPLAAQGLAFMDAKYAQPSWTRARGRWVLGELLAGAGRRAEARETLAQALTLAAALDGHERSPAYADLLQSQALAWRDAPPRAGQPVPEELLARAEAIYAGALGADSAAARRAQLHRRWLQLLAQPRDGEAVAAFAASCERWLAGAATPAAVALAQAEVALMRAQWLQRSGDLPQAREQARRGSEGWQQALGVPYGGHFVGLH